MDTDGGGWNVFQRRVDGSVDFFRNWIDYEEGFGDLNGEFWLGLSKIHRLTPNGGSFTLRVDLGDFMNETSYAQYSIFSIGDSTTNYAITVGVFSGTAGDSLSQHNGLPFSTRDIDNDQEIEGNCAIDNRGAWWYDRCHVSNLNGVYYPEGFYESFAPNGVIWESWRGFFNSLTFTEMKVGQF